MFCQSIVHRDGRNLVYKINMYPLTQACSFYFFKVIFFVFLFRAKRDSQSDDDGPFHHTNTLNVDLVDINDYSTRSRYVFEVCNQIGAFYAQT